jgi:hypothetical protein
MPYFYVSGDEALPEKYEESPKQRYKLAAAITLHKTCAEIKLRELETKLNELHRINNRTRKMRSF